MSGHEPRTRQSVTMTQSQVSGLLVAAFALVLLLLAIPAGTENVDYGWLRPASLPKALGWVLALAGLWLAVFGAEGARADGGALLRAGGLWCLMVGGLWLIHRFGFVLGAPALVLALMLVIGERRTGWLVLGAVGMPLLIWLLVVQVLGRVLP